MNKCTFLERKCLFWSLEYIFSETLKLFKEEFIERLQTKVHLQHRFVCVCLSAL